MSFAGWLCPSAEYNHQAHLSHHKTENETHNITMKPPELRACVFQTHDYLLGDNYTHGSQTTLVNLEKNLQETNNLSDKSET